MSREKVPGYVQVSKGMQGARGQACTPGEAPPKSRDTDKSQTLSVCRGNEPGGDHVPEGPSLPMCGRKPRFCLAAFQRQMDEIWGLSTVVCDLSFCCPFHFLVSPLPSIV